MLEKITSGHGSKLHLLQQRIQRQVLVVLVLLVLSVSLGISLLGLLEVALLMGGGGGVSWKERFNESEGRNIFG